MRVLVLLADAAQTEPNGKIHTLGLGWRVTSLPTPPQAIIVMVELERDEFEEGHTYEIGVRLVGEDGEPVKGTDAEGAETELSFKGAMTIGPLKFQELADAGIRSTSALAVTVGQGLPVEPGRRYEWQVSIDGRHEPEWGAEFFIRTPLRRGEAADENG